MLPEDVMRFANAQRLAALATTAPDGRPQVSSVYFSLSDRLELFFGSFEASRKIPNLRRDPRVAVAITEKPMTIQMEGIADEPQGAALARARQLKQAKFPDEFRLFDPDPGYRYVRIRPTWLRVTDFSCSPNRVIVVEPRLEAAG